MADAEEVAALDAADRLASAVAATVGDAVRSVILHGSLSAGGFRPGRSDIDLMVVVDGGLTNGQAEDLKDMVRKADLGGAAGFELNIVTAEVVRTPTPAPALELHIGRYDGTSIAFQCERSVAASPDLPTELSMAYQDGRALRGIAPRDVIAPIDAAWVVDRGRHWLRTWQSRTADKESAAFMVLTACRVWRFAVEATFSSKGQAGRWALDRRPSLTAVRQALQQYEHDPASEIDEQGIVDVLGTVLHETALAG